jgi:hypothetical protein
MEASADWAADAPLLGEERKQPFSIGEIQEALTAMC